MTEPKHPNNRDINLDKGNYNEQIGRDYIQAEQVYISEQRSRVEPKRMQQPSKFVQALIKWLPTGTGVGFTAHFLSSQQWTQAIISTLLTACTSVWVKFSSKFMETIEKAAEERGEQTAQWVVEQVDSLPTKLRWITSGFQERYQQSLVDQSCELTTEGFKIGLPVLNLEDVFVPLRVVTEIPEKIPGAIVTTHNISRSQEIWDFLAQTPKIPAYRRLAVIAPPGSGKTTLLKHLTLTYAKKAYRKHASPPFIPVLIYLRDIRHRIVGGQPPSLPELMTEQIQSIPAVQPLVPPPNWVNNLLRSGNCLVMLDGLDEVADESQRSSVSQWVNRQMETYRGAAFILTSRPHGFDSNEMRQIGTVLEVLPFTPKQTKQFIQSWYLQTEIRSRAGRDTPAVRDLAKHHADDLIKRVIRNRAIADMAKNPLLVTMIATVHYCGSVLPGRRVELYQKICDLLLGPRQEAKKLETLMTAEQKKSVLQVLALALMQRKTRAFPPEEGEALIQEELERVAGSELTPSEFLKQIKEVTGLLVERELGIYEFAHLSFQEYLAAAQVKELQQDELLTDNFQEPWWAETIRLYAAQGDATNLIRKALAHPTITSLTLALDCREESLKVDPATREQLDEMLEAGLESPDPQVAKLAAEVRLSQRLNNLLKIDENVEIDTSYITCAEYQLFVDEQLKTDERFAPGEAKKPITRISFQDAKGFCAWLGLKAPLQESSDGVPHFYRLPTETEARLYPAREHEGLACWSGSKSNSGSGIRVVKEKVPSQYIQLFNYLAAGEWKKADPETASIMLRLANRESEGWLDVDSVKKFAAEELRTIDWLWLTFSGCHFGFSVQKQIWQSIRKQQPNNVVNYKTYKTFGEHLGWCVKDNWLTYDELTFSLNAPEGYLPYPNKKLSYTKRIWKTKSWESFQLLLQRELDD